MCHFSSGQVQPRQGTEICNFGAPSPLEALHWIFCFFSSVYVQFSKTSPLKSGESSETSSGENRVKSCHVCGCYVFCWQRVLVPSIGDLEITSTSTERQKRSQNLAPVLVIISGNSLVFSRKNITSTGFYRCCTPGASAPVVVKNQSPIVGHVSLVRPC